MKMKFQNMKEGGPGEMMKGGMQGVKEGMQKMMGEEMNKMMRGEGDKEDMMSKMGGKDGMMGMNDDGMFGVHQGYGNSNSNMFGAGREMNFY